MGPEKMTSQEQDPFDELLSRLERGFPDRDSRYNHLRQKLFRFFEWRRCPGAWDLADEVMARLVKSVRAGEYVRSYAFVYQIAQYVYSEYVRAAKREESIAHNFVPATNEADPTLDCKRKCLKDLDRDKRRLLEQYYSGKPTSEELAEMRGTSVANLRLQIHRIKKKLMSCYRKCEGNSDSGGN